MNQIFLDNNSTTPIYPEVTEAMTQVLGSVYGNPSSAHGMGKTAKICVDEARVALKEFLGASELSEILFTSGGTEADSLAISLLKNNSNGKQHLITTRVEHEAIRKPAEKLQAEGFDVTWLGVDGSGNLDLTQLEESLSEQTGLVSVMLANNETGVIFPIEEIGRIVKRKSRALLHVDAVNAIGKIPLSLSDSSVDLLSLSAHKMGGPKGIGALYVRRGVSIEPMMLGGGQEFSRRAGTEAVHQIVGFGVAANISADLSPMILVKGLRDRLESALLSRFPEARVNGQTGDSTRLPNTTNISFPGLNGEVILNLLDEQGIFVSTGSACNSESKTVSPVLSAMGVPFGCAMGSIRFSLGRNNTADEINAAIDAIIKVIEKAYSFIGK